MNVNAVSEHAVGTVSLISIIHDADIVETGNE